MPACGFRAAAAMLVALVAALPFPPADSAQQDGTGGRAPSTAARVQPPPDPLSVAELLSQDLTVWLYPENRSIAVEGSLRLRANTDLSRLTLWLYETLDLLNITQIGEPLLYTRNVERLTVDLAHPLSAGGITNLSFYYNGTLWYTENGYRQDCVGWEGAYLKGSSFWYLRHHSSDWFDCRLKICCPPNWTAVADGELESEEHTAEWANYTWVNDAPMLRPALAAANYSVASKNAGSTKLSVYTYPQHSAIASAYLDEAENVMAFLEGMLGPYGRRSFKIVETAHQTMSGYACSGFVMLYPTAFSGGTVRYNLLAHETGHEWFPFATGYQGWAYPWLWEAFPEYLSCLYEMQYRGVRTRLDYDYAEYLKVYSLADVRSIAFSDWDTPHSSQILYAKGAWVLRMLHGLVGTGNFTAILKDYVDANLWGYGSAQAFLATAAKRSPVKLDGFWDQWLNTTKALDISLPAARQYENGTSFRLELWPANLLNGSNPADIQIEHADGTFQTVERGWDGRSSLLVLGVPSSVKQVRLDPEGWLLDVDRSNQAAAPLQSGKLYELCPDAPALPANITEGEEPLITARVRNDGQYMAPEVAVDFLIDGCKTARKAVDVPAQGWAEASASWLPRQGRYNITVSVDPGDALHEWNEQNNNASATVDVGPRPPRLDIWCGNLTTSPLAPMAGDPVWVTATVRNVGEGPVPAFNVTMKMDSLALPPASAEPLQPGEEDRIRQSWTAVRGVHTIFAEADPEGSLNDANPLNNHASLTFFVGWKIGLNASFWPAGPLTFERVAFAAGGDAEEFRFDFGDGTASEWGPNRTAVHEYRRSGNYTARVGARAAGVLSENSTFVVPVRNRPPEVNAWFNGEDSATLVDVFFFARPFDLDGEVTGLDWDFGDGQRARGSNVVHRYARPGRYNATFTATDNEGASNRTTFAIVARNRPPECRWTGPGQARPGEDLRFEAEASDPDGCITRYAWDFGDWTNSSQPVTSHAYKRGGKYTVTLHVWDDLGVEAAFSGTVVVVSEEKPPGEFPYGIVIICALSLMAAGVAVFLLRRRRLERQYDDFFQRPPRFGQNP